MVLLQMIHNYEDGIWSITKTGVCLGFHVGIPPEPTEPTEEELFESDECEDDGDYWDMYDAWLDEHIAYRFWREYSERASSDNPIY